MIVIFFYTCNTFKLNRLYQKKSKKSLVFAFVTYYKLFIGELKDIIRYFQKKTIRYLKKVLHLTKKFVSIFYNIKICKKKKVSGSLFCNIYSYMYSLIFIQIL